MTDLVNMNAGKGPDLRGLAEMGTEFAKRSADMQVPVDSGSRNLAIS